ncbi:MAG: dTMP kinase [Chloroflexi bacterium]|nr:dTMP kinase [Chloroflexota bacterium]
MSLFITFEGPEGCGKTTQIKLLAQALAARDCNVLSLREPGGTSIGDQIREVLHDLRNTEMHARAEILLYNAARAQIVEQRIKPHLAAGGIVLCDRFADSTLAYQGFGRGLDLSDVRHIVAFATQNLKPDLTLYLDIDVEAGLARRRTGGGEWNRMDDQTVEFYRRVREGYRVLMAEEPQRWVSIDAAREVAEIQRDILVEVEKRLTAR